MAWNWQQPDWPSFTWEKTCLLKAEELFLIESGVFAGTVKHLSLPDREQLPIEAIGSEAIATSEIEGEILNHASVRSSVRQIFGLVADTRHVTLAEQGIAEMIVDVSRSFAEPLSDQTMFRWHRMLGQGRSDVTDVGRYRTSDEYKPRPHFEAPPWSRIPQEMARFVKGFNRTAPTGPAPLPALTRAGIAHLYFLSIYPFEDGNGQIGRAIAEKALLQRAGQPTLTALAATLLARRDAYDEALEAARQSNEVTAWLSWFAGIAIEAQRRATARVEFLIDTTRLLDRMRPQLNLRQEKALIHMLREVPGGFKSGLGAGNYASITGASPATTTRDLADLVAKGAFERTGERRHARYHITIPERMISPVALDEHGNIS